MSEYSHCLVLFSLTLLLEGKPQDQDKEGAEYKSTERSRPPIYLESSPVFRKLDPFRVGRKHGPYHSMRDLQIENSQKMATKIVAGVEEGRVETRNCERRINS